MRIVVLTGAGISAESGVATFRGAGGLWEGHDIQDVATPEGFERNPRLVQQFYDDRRRSLKDVHPNAAHRALAELEEHFGPDNVTIVTQNVDDLHERGGSERVIHMHGQLHSAWCLACDSLHQWHEDLGHQPACPACEVQALRPDIVWFGEIPYRMEEIELSLRAADVFAAIGTSGEVYPAAGFVAAATSYGARTVELNLDASQAASNFDDVITGPATQVVPAWVSDLIAANPSPAAES